MLFAVPSPAAPSLPSQQRIPKLQQQILASASQSPRGESYTRKVFVNDSVLQGDISNANSSKFLTAGVQIQHHAHADCDDQQRSREQRTAQQQRHAPALRLAWPRNTEALDEHIDQIFENVHSTLLDLSVSFLGKTSAGCIGIAAP
jgi:hypothetical protein